jgi:polar amino acid transport system substrate-binding protein
MHFKNAGFAATRRGFLKAAAGLAAYPAATSLITSGLTGRAYAATGLDAIKKAGVLRVGCEAVLPPFTFRQSGEIVGYDVDVATLLCKPLGVTPQMVDTNWSGIIPALYGDRFDIIMSQMTYTKERIEKVGFAIPYVDASLAMLVRADDADKIKSTDDLAGKAIGVQLGSPGEILQKELNTKWTASGGQGFSAVKTYDDYPAAYMALAQGSVDAVFNALPTLAEVLKEAKGRYAIVQGIGPSRWAGIATRKENTELVAYLDEQMRALKSSGQNYDLQEKWFGFKMDLPDQVPAL